MGTALVPRDGQISTSSPARKRFWISVSTGRPVAMSICVAQFTLTYGMRRDQLAVGAIQHIQEAVLIGLNHHFPHLPVHRNIGQHLLVGRVHVVNIVRRVLVIANHLAGFRTDRQHAVGIQAIQTLARPRIVRLRIPGAPINQIELRIVGTRAPRRPAALRPSVAILRPRLRTRLARRRNRISAPQFLPGLRIPAVQEPARSGFAARHAGNHHAVRDNRPPVE